MNGLNKIKCLYISLLIFYFIWLYVTSFQVWQDKLFYIKDLFFDADVDSNLHSFAYGWDSGRRAISHALLEFFSLPILFINSILVGMGLISEGTKLKEILALTISPLFTVITSIYFYKILEKLNFNKIDQFVLTLIFSFSFTNLIFGILPESFAISGFLITYLIYFYLKSSERDFSNENNYVWFLLAFLLAGITISNIAIFSIVYFSYNYFKVKRGFYYSAFKTILISVIILFSIIVLYKVNYWLFDLPQGREGSVDWISTWVGLGDITNKFSNLMATFISSFIAYPIFTATNADNFIKYSFYYNFNSYSILIFLVTTAFILYLLVFCVRNKFFIYSERFPIIFICLSIIAFNFALHLVIGREMFLYTQHWVTPFFILFSFLITLIKRLKYLFLFLVSMNSFFLFNFL